MLSVFTTAEAWVSLATLTALEIVLGIDNIVFITILVGKLPDRERERARRLGIAGALITRLGLLFAISWVIGLTAPLFAVFAHEVSGRDLILMAGGLFLLAKATWEIYEKMELPPEQGVPTPPDAPRAFLATIVQIMILDIVFSLDSVITAVGMAEHLIVMVIAMVTAVAVMLAFASPVGSFVERHPSMKILALSFLLMIGVMLVAEGLGQHINKGYIYFAMTFSLAVELVQLRVRKSTSAKGVAA